MQVYLQALGCRLNEAELQNWAAHFVAKGHAITRAPEKADLVVVNTCAVTAKAAHKSRQLIRRIQRGNPLAKLVVSGCYSSLEKNLEDQIEHIDLIVHNREKDRLVEITLRQLDIHTAPATAARPGTAPLFQRGRQRAFVKIQDGCRHRCTYCIVTVARGAERSRTIHDIVDEINTLAQQGIQEAVLTGVHIGGYGSDINSNLCQLISAILDDTPLPRLRLASLEPWTLSERFFGLFENPRLMPHLHLPLQSGSDAVLKKMARRCKTSEFEKLIDQAKSVVPGLNVTTDVIVGFPGETQDEWKKSLAFIERVGFPQIHIFSYSKRAGTKAASFPGQIDARVKKARSAELNRLAATMRRTHLQRQIGKKISVLWEGGQRENESEKYSHWGYTPDFSLARIDTATERDLSNAIQMVKVKDVHRDGKQLLCACLM